MNSVPQHLHSEDRQDYERLLDEALRSAPNRPELAALGRRLNPEQLRTMALGATPSITATAANEYQHYVQVRENLRRPAPAGGPGSPDSIGTGAAGPAGGASLTAVVGDTTEAGGAGAVAVAAVLTPVLAGTAAVIFLLVGYLLKMLDPAPAFAQALVTAGWMFGAVAALAILVATVGLLLTALRNRPSLEAGRYDERSEEVERAREAWRDALLERGILPFLHEALDRAGTLPEPGPTPPPTTTRLPKIGYDSPGYARPGYGSPGYARPGFTSPEDGPASSGRPSYTSPDYTSPDFGGPDHVPD